MNSIGHKSMALTLDQLISSSVRRCPEVYGKFKSGLRGHLPMREMHLRALLPCRWSSRNMDDATSENGSSCLQVDRDAPTRVKNNVKMKQIFPIIAAAVGITFFSSAVRADDAASPAYKVGDQWSYAFVDDLTPGNNMTNDQTVVQVSSEHTMLHGKNAAGQDYEIELDPTGNVVHQGSYAPSPSDSRLKFPMAVGMTWSIDYRSGGAEYQGNNTVAAAEDVQTKAGTFQAYRIESSGTYSGTGWHETGRFRQTIWYAPSAKRIVRLDWHSAIGGKNSQITTHLEMTTVQLAP